MTALHGVLDCTGELSAQCTAGSTLKIVGELQIVAVDVPHDVAILAPATPSDLPTGSDLAPAATPPVSEDKLYALGHAQGAHTQIPWRGMLLSKWAKLKGLVPDGSSYALWSRGSPDVNETVLFINGDLVPGTSGAPVLNDQNQVVGISDGGFAGGTIGLAWAIPLAEVTPVPVATAAATLTPLSKQSTEGLFAAEALPGKSTKLRISFTTDAESFGLAQGVWTDSFDTYTLAVPADLDLANAAVEITGEGGEQLAKGNIVAAGEDKPGLYVIDVPSSGTSTPGPATVVANATPNTSSLASQSYRAFQFKKDGDLWEMIYSPIPALYPSEQPFQVSGYVLDAFRQAPVAGVEVTLRTADNRQEFSRAQTDTAGRFVLNVEHNYDKAEALLLVKANCYYPVTVYYERLSKDSVEAPVALYPSCRATPTASATSPLPTPGAGPETGTPTVTPTATLTPTPTATPTPGPIRINDMAAEPLMVLEGGSSGRDGATLKVTNPNRYGLGVAATFTNRGGWHTAFFENQGPGGNLFLQNQGDDSGAGGGDFITARAKTNRTQFAVHSNGEVASNIGFTTPAGDYAEMLPAVPGLTPGDVLAIGPDGRLVRTTEANQLTVAGVYSTAPGFVGGQPVDGAPAGSIPLAITGVVPVKASAENGPIQPGDLLVAAATPGHAMKAPANPAPGSVIGKALEPLDHGLAIIRMAAKLQ